VRIGGPAPVKRKLLLPELWLTTDGLGSYRLGTIGTDDPDATARALASFTERVQDAVIDELWGAWPPCPDHGHPLEVITEADRVTWVCPTGGIRSMDVGELGES
jgi:hypothetical protein